MSMKMYPGAKWAANIPDAAWNPLAQMSTNAPGFMTRPRDLGESPLVKSHRESALIGEGYMIAHLGAVPAGVVVGRIEGGAKHGHLVPVDFEVKLAEASSSTTFTVMEEDAKFFAKDDVVDVFGKITNIAAPSEGKVVITGSSSGSSTATVKFKLGAMRMIIDQSVVSLEHNPQTSMLYSNAVVYRNKLVNVDDEAIAAAGWGIDGQFVIMK